jgi:hypothetical protein
MRRLGRGERHDLVDDLLAERRHARGSGLVTQKALDALDGGISPVKAVLPE